MSRVIPWDAEATLNAAQQARVYEAGPQRYHLNRAVSAVYDNYHGRDIYRQEYDSVGAIVAFCSLAGVEPINLVREDHWAGDGNVDCLLPDLGRECDVKYTRLDPPYLIEDEDAKHFCGIYVLMLGTFPTYRYRGWAAFREFIRPENLTRRFGHKQTYVLGRYQIKRPLVLPLRDETEP